MHKRVKLIKFVEMNNTRIQRTWNSENMKTSKSIRLQGHKTPHKNWSFPLRISSVNVTKFAVFCGFGHIYWRNPWWKTSSFVCSEMGVLVRKGLMPQIYIWAWYTIPNSRISLFGCWVMQSSLYYCIMTFEMKIICKC